MIKYGQELIDSGTTSTIWSCSDDYYIIAKCSDPTKMDYYNSNSELYEYCALSDDKYIMKRYNKICDIPVEVIKTLVALIESLISSNEIVLTGPYVKYSELQTEISEGYFNEFKSILKYVEPIRKYINENEAVISDIKIEHIMRSDDGYVVIDPITTSQHSNCDIIGDCDDII